jgi:hypothetical protein
MICCWHTAFQTLPSVASLMGCCCTAHRRTHLPNNHDSIFRLHSHILNNLCDCLVGLRSITQGTAALESPAALPPALPPAAPDLPWLNATATSAQSPVTDAAFGDALVELPPASGTTAPEVLSLIPLLVSPLRGKITAERGSSSSSSNLREAAPRELTGQPGIATAATVARMEAQRLALLEQQQQQAAADPGAVARGYGVTAEAPAAYSEILSQHNSYRARHQAGALLWDGLLADSAAGYAAQCVFDHDAASISGESLYANSATADTAAALRSAIQKW